MKILVLTALFAVSFVSTPGQERVMNRGEFDAVVKDDKEQTLLWVGKSYRMNISVSTSVSDKPEIDYSGKSIFEKAANGSYRSIHISTLGGKSKTTEILMIGSSVYMRNGPEPWRRAEIKTGEEEKKDTASSEPSQNTGSEIEYLSIGLGECNGEKVHLYLRTERRKETDTSTGKSIDSLITTKYWINPDGLALKSEYRSVSKSGDRTRRLSIFIERELNPNLAFVEPQILPL